MNNLITCPKCNKQLISEEFPEHQCKGVGVRRIIHIEYENFFSVRVLGKEEAFCLSTDGTLYNITPSPEKRHPNRTPEEGTV